MGRRSVTVRILAGVVLVSLGTAPAPGRAANDDQARRAQEKADEAAANAQRQRDQQQLKQQQDELYRSMTRPVDARQQADAARAFARTGFDLGLAWPAAISGWSPGPGVELGFGFGDAPVRSEVAFLQATRRAGGQRLGLMKIPIFLGYRGRIGTPYLRWLLGGEVGYDQEQAMFAQRKGDIAAILWGAAAGLNAGLPLGSLYVSAGWMFHYNRRAWGTSEVASDAEISAFTSHHPTYHVFTAALGYQYR